MVDSQSHHADRLSDLSYQRRLDFIGMTENGPITLKVDGFYGDRAYKIGNRLNLAYC